MQPDQRANDEWSLKVYQPEGSAERWFFRKNLRPEIGIRHPDYGFIAYLTFNYDPDDETGLPSANDEKVLFDIEDRQLMRLEADALSIHVGTVTKSGIRDYLFYTRDPEEFLRRAEFFRAGSSQFAVECEIAPDPPWKHYDEFP